MENAARIVGRRPTVEAPDALTRDLDRRALVAGGLAAAALALVLAMPELLAEKVGDALAGLAAAEPAWLWLAVLAFVVLIVSTGRAWRAALCACGGKTSVVDAAARYSVGSLVNALLPAGSCGAVRIGLYSRLLPEGNRVLTAAGIAGAIGAARTPALAVLVVAAAVTSGFPLWPVALLVAGAAGAALVAYACRGWTPRARLAHVLDVFRALGRAPRRAAALLGWMTLATTARVAAAAAVAVAIGVEHPVEAALLMIPALTLAGVLPLTPGNVGVGSGAIAVALSFQGVDVGVALSAGIAFQALETAVSLGAGAAGMLYLAGLPAWSTRLAGTGACLVLVAAVGGTVLL